MCIGTLVSPVSRKPMGSASCAAAVRALGVAVAAALLACRCAAQPSGSGCMPELVGLSPCMDYLSGNATTPDVPSCCSALSGMLRSSPGCLCTVLGGTAASLGVAVDGARVAQLPGACKVQAPPATQCNGECARPASRIRGNGKEIDTSRALFVQPWELQWRLRRRRQTPTRPLQVQQQPYTGHAEIAASFCISEFVKLQEGLDRSLHQHPPFHTLTEILGGLEGSSYSPQQHWRCSIVCEMNQMTRKLLVFVSERPNRFTRAACTVWGACCSRIQRSRAFFTLFTRAFFL